MKKRALVLFLLMCVLVGRPLVATTITSPNGKLEMRVTVENEKAVYAVLLNGTQFLQSSPLGMKTNVGDFSSGLALANDIKKQSINESYS